MIELLSRRVWIQKVLFLEASAPEAITHPSGKEVEVKKIDEVPKRDLEKFPKRDSETKETEDDEEEEEETCEFCKFMKAGGCKEAFVVIQALIHILSLNYYSYLEMDGLC